MVEINDRLSIPENELRFTASRSSGPGGQHVNKVSSRVTLHFDVANSPSLEEAQRRRIRTRLATRVNREGVLRIHSQRHRSQAANRAVLVDRFAELIREALKRRRPRKRTKPSKGAVEQRLQEKKHRGRLKRSRGRADPQE